MGGSQSVTCRHPVNQDLRSVFTLSDSAIQRLPLDAADSPLQREQRKQNIDNFWRERLLCLDETFLEEKGITEKEFQRLEFTLLNETGLSVEQPFCTRDMEETKSCYLSFPEEPMKCDTVCDRFQLCLNTMMQHAAKKRMAEDKKDDKIC